RNLVRVLARDALVHVEQVPVLLADALFAVALDGVAEVEVDAAATGTDAAAVVALLLRSARGDVARRQVAEARVLALEVVVARVLGNLIRVLADVLLALRYPDASVVAQRLGHQRQLRLVVAGDRNAGRVDLREARVREAGATLVRAVRRGDVAALRVRRQ